LVVEAHSSSLFLAASCPTPVYFLLLSDLGNGHELIVFLLRRCLDFLCQPQSGRDQACATVTWASYKTAIISDILRLFCTAGPVSKSLIIYLTLCKGQTSHVHPRLTTRGYQASRRAFCKCITLPALKAGVRTQLNQNQCLKRAWRVLVGVTRNSRWK